MAEFTWVPIYAELADKVLEYRERQAELIGLLERLRADGLPVNASGDQFADGTTGVMKEIDPFTFFSNFNRGVTDDNRRAILSALKREFGLTRSLPTDFTGIPTVNNQASWFIAYQKDRKPTDVPTLWDIAASTRRDGAEGLDAELFVRGLAINRVALAKLTMGMFWFRPDGFVALDRNMKAYLEANGIAVGKIATVAEYRDVIHRVREKFGGDFKRISVDAPSRERGKPMGKGHVTPGLGCSAEVGWSVAFDGHPHEAVSARRDWPGTGKTGGSTGSLTWDLLVEVLGT